MSGRLINDNKKCKMLLKDLMDSVKECQNVYGKNKTLLATEKDIRKFSSRNSSVQRLCNNWETALSHGLKTVSVFKNIVSGNLTAELASTTFWDFAFQHLTGHEKERFSTLRHVYTDQGKARALIRAALNERAMERYILMWLNDTNGLNARYESWALIRDNEASNLLPSIAAGLGSILFAITVDCPELNVAPAFEVKSQRQSNEIIIAVPTVNGFKERKSTGAKRSQIISFEDDEEAQSTSVHRIHNSLSATPAQRSQPVSLSDACLKFVEREKIQQENAQPFVTDSTYERITHSVEPIAASEAAKANETDYIEPESPTSIKIYSPILSAKTYPMFGHSFDSKETDLSISKATDSSSSTPNTTTNSSTSAPQPISSQPSQSESMHSSMSSVHHSSLADTVATTDVSENVLRIQELEKRCFSLEEQVTALTLENARLKSMHHNLVAGRQSSKYFSVSIPRVLLQHSENSNKKFYAYEIQIVPLDGSDNGKWSLLRRYREFFRLHKYLQKDIVTIKTLDFPPKKSFGNMNAEFVEQRRQRLQLYLLSVLSLMPEISKCYTRSQLEHAFPFFKQSHRL